MAGLKCFKKEYFECSCSSMDHLVRFMYMEDDGELFMDYHLRLYSNVFKRIWYAICYILNATPNESIWDEVVFDNEEIDKLYDLLTRIKEIKESKEK